MIFRRFCLTKKQAIISEEEMGNSNSTMTREKTFQLLSFNGFLQQGRQALDIEEEKIWRQRVILFDTSRRGYVTMRFAIDEDRV